MPYRGLMSRRKLDRNRLIADACLVLSVGLVIGFTQPWYVRALTVLLLVMAIIKSRPA